MSEKKKGSILPRVELIVIGLFICLFLVWSVSKCNATRAKYAAMEQTEEENNDQDSAVVKAEETPPSAPKPEAAVTRSADELPRTIRERYTPLYVTLDNLKVRAKPSLGGKVITELSLFEEVTFLNEITNFEQEINLGFELAKEPWIKIKTERGYVGWVYGAGVHYYKKRRKPAEETQENVN